MQLFKIIGILALTLSSALASDEPPKPISWPQYEMKMNYVSGDSLARALNLKNCNVQFVNAPKPGFFAACVVALKPARVVLKAESKGTAMDPREALLWAGGAVIVSQIAVHREDLKHFQVSFIEWLNKAVRYGIPMFKDFGLKFQSSGESQMGTRERPQAKQISEEQDSPETKAKKAALRAAGLNVQIKEDPDISEEDKPTLIKAIAEADGEKLAKIKRLIDGGTNKVQALEKEGLITEETAQKILKPATIQKAIRFKAEDPDLIRLIEKSDYGTLVQISEQIGENTSPISIRVEVGDLSPKAGARKILQGRATTNDELEDAKEIVGELEYDSPTTRVNLAQFRKIMDLVQEDDLTMRGIGNILCPGLFDFDNEPPGVH